MVNMNNIQSEFSLFLALLTASLIRVSISDSHLEMDWTHFAARIIMEGRVLTVE